MSAVAASIRELPGFRPGRDQERDDIVRYIRQRRDSVDNFIKRGRLTAKEGSDLRSWLKALAEDIEAELHVEDGD